MNVRAIPTMYRGRRYRSRLEARWAVMFDLLGWRYEYEPFDMCGWIPDFVLDGPRPVLVEVKPFRCPELAKVGAALAAGESDSEVLALYATPFDPTECGSVALGDLLRGPHSNEWCCAYTGVCAYPDTACIGRIGRAWDFSASNGRWYGRLTQANEGGDVEARSDRRPWPDHTTGDQLRALWAMAGNTVQWRAPA